MIVFLKLNDVLGSSFWAQPGDFNGALFSLHRGKKKKKREEECSVLLCSLN